jgi:arylsulfatase A-like enzyme
LFPVLSTCSLGFGDLSVAPFRTPYEEKNFPCTEGGILTPELERMAREGVRMTNFHASAPVCSPSRTSAMTGLYPWRMTAMNAFELGRDPMQRNGFLPQIPTIPEIFRENGYFTVHSGKWHLGGLMLSVLFLLYEVFSFRNERGTTKRSCLS